ncbi:MAG: ABC transporter ATP-binding protein [Candidatus Thorarchaeota archaeon]
MGNDIAIKVSGLTKIFGKGEQQVKAVDNISLQINQGEIFGFLGPNGAGKTTSLRMMVGLLEPTKGEVEILGINPKEGQNEIKRVLGIIPQEISLYPELTVEENMKFLADAYKIPKEVAKERINRLIQALGLEDKRRTYVKNLSGGLKRRTNLIVSLIHDPDIILCDEPTPGLDPQSRVVVWDFIKNLKEKHGKTVILTTHFMEEADRLSDRVAIIDHGKVLVMDNPAKLKASIGEGDLLELELADANEEQLETFVNDLKGFGKPIEDAYSSGGRILVRALDIVRNLAKILNSIEDKGAVVENMSIRNTTLEDVFINLTGRALRN